MRAAVARANVEVLEETVCSELLVHDGEVVGAAAFQIATGEPVALLAKATVVAAGGAGSLYYPHTDCMPSVVGDSYGLALAAGAEIVDMEQVQYLPFAITHPPAMLGAPCGEPAFAGPLGKLLNARGEVVLENIMPMTRAQVARIIMEEIKRGGATEHGGLLLDLTENVKSPAGENFIALVKKFGGPFLAIIRKAYGVKAADLEEPWDVLPTVHYNMGGIKTDEWCRSRAPALYACGQAQGGVMGGNRLGSTSLTEIFVFGKRAGITAAHEAKEKSFADDSIAREPLEKLQVLPGTNGTHRPIQLKRMLQQLMWDDVGPLRDGEGLERALERIGTIRRQAGDLCITAGKSYNSEMVDAIELSHMLCAAEAITLSALSRTESRGAHVRADYPERDDDSPVANIVVQSEKGRLTSRRVAKNN
jgi:succinate dehydrogenase/fumarate reductase flavoprotein subunit